MAKRIKVTSKTKSGRNTFMKQKTSLKKLPQAEILKRFCEINQDRKESVTWRDITWLLIGYIVGALTAGLFIFSVIK